MNSIISLISVISFSSLDKFLIFSSKLFILLDDVQFEKKSWQSRNRIRTVNGTTFLSVPVHAHLDSKINEIKIDNSKNWADKKFRNDSKQIG